MPFQRQLERSLLPENSSTPSQSLPPHFQRSFSPANMSARRVGTLDSKRGALELEKKKREELSKDGVKKAEPRREFKPTDNELKAISSVFHIYDVCSEGSIDASTVPLALRALGLNPTLGLVEKIAGTVKEGEKRFSIEEFIPIYGAIKNDKDNGVYEDFIECLKLYDKSENGLIQLGELTHALLSLGERLNENELDEVLEDCMDSEDDDGYIPYIPFLARMCEKPVPKTIKPQ